MAYWWRARWDHDNLLDGTCLREKGYAVVVPPEYCGAAWSCPER